MLQRTVLTTCLLLFLVLVLAAVWTGFDWPPARLILKYGFPPTGGPTGRTMTIEGVEFVELKPGYFRMGSHFLCQEGDLVGRICVLLHLPWGKQPKHDSNECPPHWVEIQRPYWIARTEVTNEQYERFDPNRNRVWLSQDDRDPASMVCWEEAQRYCGWLSSRGALAVRLPSESEWENASRAGSNGEYCFGSEEALLANYAWFHANSEGHSHKVGTRRPNAWGLHDMHGNVWEWCEDTYHADYNGAPEDGRPWMESGMDWWPSEPARIWRGGGWHDPARHCRSAYRPRNEPGPSQSLVGFRPTASWNR